MRMVCAAPARARVPIRSLRFLGACCPSRSPSVPTSPPVPCPYPYTSPLPRTLPLPPSDPALPVLRLAHCRLSRAGMLHRMATWRICCASCDTDLPTAHASFRSWSCSPKGNASSPSLTMTYSPRALRGPCSWRKRAPGGVRQLRLWKLHARPCRCREDTRALPEGQSERLSRPVSIRYCASGSRRTGRSCGRRPGGRTVDCVADCTVACSHASEGDSGHFKGDKAACQETGWDERRSRALQMAPSW
jgi:hypothetical protein